MTSNLQDRFDALLLDLDGVVYVGPHAVPGAAPAIEGARAAGLSCGFITNNASRSPGEVADHLVELGIPATAADVITSPQAAVSVLPDFVPPGSAVLVIGGAGIEVALREGGYRPVRALEEGPAAVMQGFSPTLTWRDLATATFAVRQGLPWIATNPDRTFPTPEGIAPGNGALVDVVARTAGRAPDAIAGKPEPPLLREAMRRLAAARPLMVGDRLDTDIEAGTRVSVPTLLVLTGVTTLEDVLAAVPAERPTYLGADLGVLARPYPSVVVESDTARCGAATARVRDGLLELVGEPDEEGDGGWNRVRAAAAAVWAAADAGRHVDLGQAVGVLAAR